MIDNKLRRYPCQAFHAEMDQGRVSGLEDPDMGEDQVEDQALDRDQDRDEDGAPDKDGGPDRRDVRGESEDQGDTRLPSTIVPNSPFSSWMHLSG